MSEKITVYHNPRCSKSRATVEWLGQHGYEFETIEYLKQPLTKESLQALLRLLGTNAEQIIRKGEKVYKELKLSDSNPSEDEFLEAIAEHPILLERPIVTTESDAAIGRPLQNIIDLFDD